VSVTPAYRTFVIESLGRIEPVTARAMFGGVGLYARGLFFGLIDDDVLYFKVDGSTRGAYEDAGSGPFRPAGEGGAAMAYYELPAELLEGADGLRPWMEAALDVARRARKSPGRRSPR
jgi:DNA transformation protein and related proteins